MPLKYLSNSSRSLEMLLINCKVELKVKWTKYYVLFVAYNDNITNSNLNNNNSNSNSCCDHISKRQSKIIKTSQQKI